MPHDLTLPNITGQTPYDVEESIDRLRGFGLALGAEYDALDARLQALGAAMAETQAVLNQQAANVAGLLVASIETTEITVGGVPVPGPPGIAAVWGSITGTLSDQLDLQVALDAKQDLLVFNPALCAYVIPL